MGESAAFGSQTTSARPEAERPSRKWKAARRPDPAGADDWPPGVAIIAPTTKQYLNLTPPSSTGTSTGGGGDFVHTCFYIYISVQYSHTTGLIMASLTRRAGGPGPLSRPCVVDQGRCRLLGTDAKSWTVFFFVICPKRVNRPPHRAPKFLHLDFTSYGLQQIYYGSRCCRTFSPPGRQAVRASKRPYCECPGLHPPGTSPCRTGFMASRTQGASILLSDVRARDALASDIACDSLRGQQKKRAHPLPGSLNRGGVRRAALRLSGRAGLCSVCLTDGWMDG